MSCPLTHALASELEAWPSQNSVFIGHFVSCGVGRQSEDSAAPSSTRSSGRSLRATAPFRPQNLVLPSPKSGSEFLGKILCSRLTWMASPQI